METRHHQKVRDIGKKVFVGHTGFEPINEKEAQTSEPDYTSIDEIV